MGDKKKKIMGGKKAVMEATAVVNPESGRLAVSKEEVLKITLKYCKDTLAKNEPEEGFEDGIKRKKELVKDILNIEGCSFKATNETFKKMVDKFKRSKKRTGIKRNLFESLILMNLILNSNVS